MERFGWLGIFWEFLPPRENTSSPKGLWTHWESTPWGGGGTFSRGVRKNAKSKTPLSTRSLGGGAHRATSKAGVFRRRACQEKVYYKGGGNVQKLREEWGGKIQTIHSGDRRKKFQMGKKGKLGENKGSEDKLSKGQFIRGF